MRADRMAGAWSVAALVGLIGLGCAPGDGASEAGGEAAVRDLAASGAPDGVPSGAKAAPDDVFRALDGGEAGFDDLLGNVVVANLWGTWCLPCRDELPELVELARIYSDRPVVVLGLAVDSGDVDEIRDFLEEFGVEYPNWMIGMDDAVATFGAVGFPTTVMVDPEGWIRKELLGPQTAASLTAEIEALLP
ncbi:MAG: TlpA family protein disulfide reductase [Gemmatimonadales bacterium]|uniref:TlpA family protein disulfide reductase n=1 Tax=Candidatus Palauibacter irciniicola TaxID=3056733 RepID=UPI00137F139E|nr:TlpA family protein disulfide reductase [Candidatus Palauibacter irciniicola]MYC19119.1 TlpA family protein disulfide reductase [Gemmatimonadales bacterium]